MSIHVTTLRRMWEHVIYMNRTGGFFIRDVPTCLINSYILPTPRTLVWCTSTHFMRLVVNWTQKIWTTATSRALRQLKTNSSSGPDGLPPIMFKKLASELAYPLSLLFQSSMSTGQLPAEWKTVSPIYKSGIACDVSNYWPISLTCIACKVMERIIVQRMLNYLKANNILTRQQHGFMARRSTTSNLLDSLNDWTLAINNKSITIHNCCICGLL